MFTHIHQQTRVIFAVNLTGIKVKHNSCEANAMPASLHKPCQ